MKNSTRNQKQKGPGRTTNICTYNLKNGKKRKRQNNTDCGRKKRKEFLKSQDKLKWDKLGGSQRICMRVHQYDLPALKRIVQLGACPTARGSFVPTARIASHMVNFGQVVLSQCLFTVSVPTGYVRYTSSKTCPNNGRRKILGKQRSMDIAGK